MKVKRVKNAKRLLSFYQHNFGLRQPYQVIVDGTFAQAALKAQILIKEQLPKYLSGPVQLFNTRCAVMETRRIGPSLAGATLILKRFEQLRCKHSLGQAISTSECILCLIGEKNENHYLVATQDDTLRVRLRKIPGVPLLLITHNAIAIEKPSRVSQRTADTVAADKLLGSATAQNALEQLSTSLPSPGVSRKRRHRLSGPNPMSCKKKKKKSPPLVAEEQEKSSRKPKKRRARQSESRPADERNEVCQAS